MIFESIGKGFILGLSLGLTCLGICLPVLIPVLIIKKRALRESFAGIAWFLGGRFAGYIIFGAIAGAIGGRLNENIRLIATSAGYIILAALLIFSAFKKKRDEAICPLKKWEKFSSHPALFGLLIGISPCPAFFLALTGAVQTGGALSGAMLFAGFFLGTSIFFIPIGFFGILGRSEALRKIGRFVAVIVGIWFALAGIIALNNILKANEKNDFEIVDPDDLGSIYVWGDSVSLYLFFESVDPRTVNKFKIRKPDETPDKSLLVVIGELPDTNALLIREVSVIHADRTKTGIDKAAKTLATFGFKKPRSRGFYFKVN